MGGKHASRSEVVLRPPAGSKEPPKTFTFDHAFGPEATQHEIYTRVAAPIVESVLDGFNGTIFAYGQTGAGKSHSMEGPLAPPEERGVMPQAFSHIFEAIAARAAPGVQTLVRASYLEIYNEDIRDLLARGGGGLELKEHPDTGVYVRDLTSVIVRSADELAAVLSAGRAHRSTGATLMNETSSRSHSIFSVAVETSVVGADGESHIRVGRLHMVDLAGSERQTKTGATGARLKEAVKINLSLSALGNVISALVDGKSTHVPYRDSKLTRLLQDSLGGNARTAMLANCGPADYNLDETLSTLRYAARAKSIRNRPTINEDPKDAMLREFQAEIARLRAQLDQRGNAGDDDVILPDGRRVGVPLAHVPATNIIEHRLGATEEELRELRRRAEEERAELLARAAAEQEAILRRAAQTEAERQFLESKMAERVAEHEEALRARRVLEEQLEALQEKVIVGGQVLDLAAKQEEELRRAQVELDERRRQEEVLAKDLAEANLIMDEQYATMADEIEAKTRKIAQMWEKLQATQQELRDTVAEFQVERVDMLDSIRELGRQVKLKSAILDRFVAPRDVEFIEATMLWNEDSEEWDIPHGTELLPLRPTRLSSISLATEVARRWDEAAPAAVGRTTVDVAADTWGRKLAKW